MTTTPRAKRFNTRPTAPAKPEAPGAEAPGAMLAAPEDGFGAMPVRAPAPDRTAQPAAPAQGVAAEIAAIRGEGLTGRQLRMARRVALQNGLEPTSDYDAVRLLRRRGIDPFHRGGFFEVIAGGGNALPAPGEVPAAVPGASPATPAEDAEAARAREILRIQRDIARRRQRRLAMLAARLVAFVLLPTLVAGWYWFRIATPLFGTQSEFVIQQADAGATAGGGGMFSGMSLATAQDSITVQSYLLSRDAMLRLDRDHGFRAHFSGPGIDPRNRLDPDATMEAAYRLYQRMITIGFDPMEGILRMEVVAADPETSAAFARALIGYAEDQVDQLTQRLRADQMDGARASYEEAEARVLAAQARVLELQERLGVIDPASETGGIMGRISGFETELAKKRLELGQLLDNARPNPARVDGVRGDIARLEAMIAELRAPLTRGAEGAASLAAMTGQLRIAEADLATRQQLLAQAAQQLEAARIEATKQVRYLSLGVPPVPPDEATYPRAAENTLLALLVFGGIYLMASLTVSILREQVAA